MSGTWLIVAVGIACAIIGLLPFFAFRDPKHYKDDESRWRDRDDV